METNHEIIDRLTNALQSALLLAARLEPDVRQSARDAAQLFDAVSKASSAAHELRRGQAGLTPRIAPGGR